MSFKRSILVAIATLITVGMTQVAFAQNGCGGCGTAVYAPVIYATPVAPQPIAVGCGNCGAPVTCCRLSVARLCRAVFAELERRLRRLRSSGRVRMAMAGAIAAAAIAELPRSTRRRRRSTPSSTRARPLRAPASTARYHSYAPPVEYAPPPAYPSYAGGYAAVTQEAMVVVMAAVMRIPIRCTSTSPMGRWLLPLGWRRTITAGGQ